MKNRLSNVVLAAGLSLTGPCARSMAQQNKIPWPGGKRAAVSLSFDDARRSQIDVGLPLFDKHGVKVTFFVNPPNMRERLDGWKTAVAHGHEIGNHTSTHPCTLNYPGFEHRALENYTLDDMQKEIERAEAEIKAMLGVTAVTFAYPCGQKFVGRGVELKSYIPLIAKRYQVGRGFRDEGANDPAGCDLAHVMGMESDGLTFGQMKALVEDAKTRGAWLVFAGHEIGPENRQTTVVSALEEFFRYAQNPANGIWLDTVAAVGRYIESQRANAQ